jgi:hypothetical protein
MIHRRGLDRSLLVLCLVAVALVVADNFRGTGVQWKVAVRNWPSCCEP